MSIKTYLDDNSLAYLWNAKIKPLLQDKVSREYKTGSQNEYKVLSDNNFTNELKAKLDSIGAVMSYKGSVDTYEDLPTEGNIIGDTWNVSKNGSNYAWNGTDWDDLGGAVDLSEYVKADELVAITNAEIDTICV